MQQIFILQVSRSEQQLSSEILIDTVYKNIVLPWGEVETHLVKLFLRLVVL